MFGKKQFNFYSMFYRIAFSIVILIIIFDIFKDTFRKIDPDIYTHKHIEKNMAMHSMAHSEKIVVRELLRELEDEKQMREKQEKYMKSIKGGFIRGVLSSALFNGFAVENIIMNSVNLAVINPVATYFMS